MSKHAVTVDPEEMSHMNFPCLPRPFSRSVVLKGLVNSESVVACLTADTCLTADPGIVSSTPARSHTFVKIDYEIISTAILLPSADSRRAAVSYKPKYVHEVLVNRLVKIALKKGEVG